MQRDSELLFDELISILDANRVKSQVAQMKKYMKGQYEYYGLKSPHRREVTNDIVLESKKLSDADFKDFIKFCWENPHREPQYVAMEALKRRMNKMDESYIDFTLDLIQHKSWWDTVDFLASTIFAKLMQRFPDKNKTIPDRLICSDNIWLKRTAIIYQLKYKDELDFERLKKYILSTSGSKEFFINKATGWALRQYSKHNRDAVYEFIHNNELHSLTKREGSKYL